MLTILVRLQHPLVWSYLTAYSIGCGLAQGWYPDTSADAALTNTGLTVRHGYLIEKPDPKGSFQCAIPMQHIRFCG